MQERARVRTAGVDLAINAFAAVEVRWLFVPLTFGNNVPQFVVGEAEDKLDSPGHEGAERRHFHRGDIKITARCAFNSPIDDLGINFAGHAGDARIPDLCQGDLGAIFNCLMPRLSTRVLKSAP